MTPQQQEIQQLLADAQQQMDNRRLTAPASGNALRSYQRVLELEADNPPRWRAFSASPPTIGTSPSKPC